MLTWEPNPTLSVEDDASGGHGRRQPPLPAVSDRRPVTGMITETCALTPWPLFMAYVVISGATRGGWAGEPVFLVGYCNILNCNTIIYAHPASSALGPTHSLQLHSQSDEH